MKRHARVLALGVVGIALLVPSALAGTPNGVGLFREHESTCTGGSFEGSPYHGLVTLTGANSFWVNEHHLVIQSVEITYDGDPTAHTYTFGTKVGKTDTMVTCEGDFPGYHVVSHDVVAP